MEAFSNPVSEVIMSYFSGRFGKLKPCYYNVPFTTDNRPECAKGQYVNVEGYFTEWTVPLREFGGVYHEAASWNDSYAMSQIVEGRVILPWNLWDTIIFRLDWEQAKDLLQTMNVKFNLDGEYVDFEDHPKFQDRDAKYAYILLDMGS